MWVDTNDALEANGMEVFTNLLGHAASSVRMKAARDIMDLSVPLAGKDRAVDLSTVPELVKLLHPAQPACVRSSAAGALMMYGNECIMMYGRIWMKYFWYTCISV